MPDGREFIAQRAEGLASEALSAIRSHERMTDLRFKNHDEKVEDIKGSIEGLYGKFGELNDKMDKGFKSYDNKFWSLAIALIGILLGICTWFINFVVNHSPLVGGH